VELEEYVDRIMEFGTALNGRDELYYDKIVWPWIADIFPARSMQYGTEGLFRFGSKGVFAQVINCYYRLKQTHDLLDTLRDVFGFSVIMSVVTEVRPSQIDWGYVYYKTDPDIDTTEEIFERLVEHVWYGEEFPESATVNSEDVFGLAHRLWRRSSYARSEGLDDQGSGIGFRGDLGPGEYEMGFTPSP
jgi:hypothetical protein